MNHRVLGALAALTLGLAACGGQHLAPTLPTTPNAPFGRTAVTPYGRIAGSPDRRFASGPSIKAWGTLVDYDTGVPIAGQPVKLMPWHLCAFTPEHYSAAHPERFICPKPVATAITGPQGYFSFHAPPGLYLLVIGPDQPGYPPPKYATVHDKLWIYASPNPQRLLAPNICTYTGEPRCLPPVYYDAKVRNEADPNHRHYQIQESGDYRLARLDTARSKAEEWPCIKVYNHQRAIRGLVQDVVDEWSTENIRMFVTYFDGPQGGVRVPAPVDGYGRLAGVSSYESGGSNCTGFMQWAFDPKAYASGGPYSAPTNPQAEWMAADYEAYNSPWAHNGSGTGMAEFPRDPRGGYKDPFSPAYWP